MKFAAAIFFTATLCFAQGILADYQRAQKLQSATRGLVVNIPGTPNWIADSNHFWYTRSVKGGTEFVLVDAANSSKKLAFDHEVLATAINEASGGHYTALALPFAPATGGRGAGGGGGRGAFGPAPGALTFSDNDQTIEFGAVGSMYKCTLADYKCTKGGPIPAAAPTGGRGNAPEADPEDDGILAAPYVPEVNSADGVELVPPQQGFAGGGAGRGQG
ncbi:MAG TPA: hypothetical protein VKE70_24175, partial [Candidatus Solibacter sp.]|nr:hypothetical protein [Candidatus Solibacter sp.]